MKAVDVEHLSQWIDDQRVGSFKWCGAVDPLLARDREDPASLQRLHCLCMFRSQSPQHAVVGESVFADEGENNVVLLPQYLAALAQNGVQLLD